MKKGTKLYSIFKMKCPECHEGQFFESNNPYKFKTMGDVKEKCSHCGLKYEKEPGFYQGSMYVSYALGVAVFVTCWVGIYILYPGYTAELLLGVLAAVMLLGGPYLYALSKIIWANMFMHFKGQQRNKSLKFEEHERTT